MALGKPGTRPLTHEGRGFRWRCEFNDPLEALSVGYRARGESWPPDTLVVRPVDGPHRRLTVTWPACKGPVVTPGVVRACVREALRRGWLTDQPELALAGSDVTTGGADPD